MRAADRCSADFGQADVADFAFFDELGEGGDGLLDWDFSVGAVHVEQIDVWKTEALKDLLACLANAEGKREITDNVTLRWIETYYSGSELTPIEPSSLNQLLTLVQRNYGAVII